MPVPLEKTPRDLVRFASREDKNYIKLEKAILGLIPASERPRAGVERSQGLAPGLPKVDRQSGKSRGTTANIFIFTSGGEHKDIPYIINDSIVKDTPFTMDQRASARKYTWIHAPENNRSWVEVLISSNLAPIYFLPH